MTCPNCERLEIENKDLRERLSGTWNQKDLLDLNKDLMTENARLKEENKNLWDLAESVKTLMDSMGSPSEYRAALVDLHVNYKCCVWMRGK